MEYSDFIEYYDSGLDTGSQFPRYKDGDVMICFSDGRLYMLHSTVLRANSPVLARFVDESRGAKLTTKAKNEGVTLRFALDLTGHGQGPKNFTQRRVTETGGAAVSSALMNMKADTVPQKTLDYHDKLFRAFYNLPIVIGGEKFGSILKDAIGLLEVAEEYNATNAIASQVEAGIMGRGKILWRSISAAPVDWASIGQRVKSRPIVKECVIHLVGKWQSLENAQKESLGVELWNLCETKNKYLNNFKRGVEMRMLGHYSKYVCKTRLSEPKVSEYGADILSWMAICLFRHWLGQAISEERTWRAADGGFSTYHKIHRAGETYISRYDQKPFHDYCPMHNRSVEGLRRHLLALKNEMKKWVEPLMINNTQVELKPNEYFAYLVCVNIVDEDLDLIACLNGGRQPRSSIKSGTMIESVNEDKEIAASTLATANPRKRKRQQVNTAKEPGRIKKMLSTVSVQEKQNES